MSRPRTTLPGQPRLSHAHRRLANPDGGMISAFVAVAMVGLLVVLGLGLDPGLAFAVKVHALGQAEEAARAGAQQIDLTTYRTTGAVVLDPAAAEIAAEHFLAAEGATGTATATTTQVSVTVTTTYRTTIWQVIGIHTVAVQATGTAVPHPNFAAGTP